MNRAEIDNYLNSLQKSGLVTKEQLSQVLGRVIKDAGGKQIEPEHLARAFEQANLVTAWHNEKLLKGKYRGFLLGNYKLLGHIATGGMSNIYLAEHTAMKRRVAIKVLPPNFTQGTGNTSHLSRFYVESRVIAQLDHPNIVRAYDVSQQGSFHYLVMEFVEGSDLRHMVEENGPLPIEVAADYIRQAADGLNHAHQKGIVHRDVKPANLLVDQNGTVKLLDLGLTRVTDSSDPSLTLAHNEKLIGTVDYIAPEQAANCHNVDARADIYSLGCTLYFVVCGRPPFPDGSQTQRLLAHQTQEAVSLLTLRDETPLDLWQICRRMMAKKPKDRYQSAGEVVRELANFLSSRGGSKVMGGLPAGYSMPMGSGPAATSSLSSRSSFDIELGHVTDVPSSLVGKEGLEGEAEVNGGSARPGSHLARIEALDAREAQLTRREDDLQATTREVEEKLREHDRRRLELEQAQQKLTDLEQYLEKKAADMERRAGDILAREEQVKQREFDLLHRMEELQAVQYQVDRQKQELRSLHEQISQSKSELAKKQEQMAHQAEEFATRARSLGQSLRDLEAHRRDMQRREHDIAEREAKLKQSALRPELAPTLAPGAAASTTPEVKAGPTRSG